jgi:hypothetical protein
MVIHKVSNLSKKPRSRNKLSQPGNRNERVKANSQILRKRDRVKSRNSSGKLKQIMKVL